ncbi:hypothetical protein ACEUZ9_004665 [Paracoccus litorisediminis]|uniref:hypothetical protein n=1 Tax=Paracoccus litorisediminis TaxID=2006130 RepID=UPI0037349A82
MRIYLKEILQAAEEGNRMAIRKATLLANAVTLIAMFAVMAFIWCAPVCTGWLFESADYGIEQGYPYLGSDGEPIIIEVPDEGQIEEGEE